MFDELWRGGPRFLENDVSFRLSTDSVMLTAFVNIKNVKNCLDLGTGAGVLPVILAYKNEKTNFVGLEIQEPSVEVSRQNAEENGFADRIKIIHGDILDTKSIVASGSFDLVISNPPYFVGNSGYLAPESKRATARAETACSLRDLCRSAKWALKYGGTFAMVHRPERLSEIMVAMTEFGIEPKRLRFVCLKAGRAPSLVLIEGKRGAKPSLTIEAPLILTDENGEDSDEVKKIYRRGVYSGI